MGEKMVSDLLFEDFPLDEPLRFRSSSHCGVLPFISTDYDPFLDWFSPLSMIYTSILILRGENQSNPFQNFHKSLRIV